MLSSTKAVAEWIGACRHTIARLRLTTPQSHTKVHSISFAENEPSPRGIQYHKTNTTRHEAASIGVVKAWCDMATEVHLEHRYTKNRIMVSICYGL